MATHQKRVKSLEDLQCRSCLRLQGHRRGQHLQGRRNREDPGRPCSWDVTESVKEQMAVESSDGTWIEEVRSRSLGA